MATRIVTVLSVLLLAALVAPAARADAIDGKWCFGGKRLEIAGPSIVTPGGSRIEGRYDRHAFSYVVPAGEPGAGTQVDMDLHSDDDMQLWPAGRGTDPAAAGAQHWKRCAAEVSEAR